MGVILTGFAVKLNKRFQETSLCENAERFLLFEIDIKKDLWYSIISKFLGVHKGVKKFIVVMQ